MAQWTKPTIHLYNSQTLRNRRSALRRLPEPQGQVIDFRAVVGGGPPEGIQLEGVEW